MLCTGGIRVEMHWNKNRNRWAALLLFFLITAAAAAAAAAAVCR